VRKLLAVLAFLFCSGYAHAQSCSPVFTTNYVTYKSRTLYNMTSTSAGLETSQTVYGSANMTVDGSCPSWVQAQIQQQISNSTHTPRAYSTWGSTGGWEAGVASCYNCYYNFTTYNDVANVSYGSPQQQGGEGQVNCSMGGTIFDVINPLDYIEAAYTATKNKCDASGSCSPYSGGPGSWPVDIWCPDERTPPDWEPGVAHVQSNWAYFQQYAICARPGTSGPWVCVRVLDVGNSGYLTSDRLLNLCTKTS